MISLKKKNRGTAGLEMAIVLPILLLIFFAIIEYGWCFVNWIMLHNAVSEGARAGIRARDWETENAHAEDPVAFAREAAVDAFWLSPLPANEVNVVILEADGNKPKRIKVEILEHPYKSITGYLLKSMIPESLGARAVMAFP